MFPNPRIILVLFNLCQGFQEQILNLQLRKQLDLTEKEIGNYSVQFFKIYFTQLFTYILNPQGFSIVNAVQISKIFPPKDLEKYACAVFFLIKLLFSIQQYCI